MWELIITVALQLVSWLFKKDANNEKLAQLIAQWIVTMRKMFQQSPAIYKSVESILKQAEVEPWQETK